MKKFDEDFYYIYDYDQETYCFQSAVAGIFNMNPSDLEYIHKFPQKILDNNFCESIYSNKTFMSTYQNFAARIIKKVFGFTRMVYQKQPNIKIYPPLSNTFLGCYTNLIKQNNNETITILLPLTHMYDTNTIWVTSKTDSETLTPQTISNHQYLAYCQQKLVKGFKTNKTNTTSMFMDFMITSYESYTNIINSPILDPSASVV